MYGESKHVSHAVRPLHRIKCRENVSLSLFSAYREGCVDMERLIVEGKNRLKGELSVHGAKNSALPILAASLV